MVALRLDSVTIVPFGKWSPLLITLRKGSFPTAMKDASLKSFIILSNLQGLGSAISGNLRRDSVTMIHFLKWSQLLIYLGKGSTPPAMIDASLKLCIILSNLQGHVKCYFLQSRRHIVNKIFVRYSPYPWWRSA